MRGTGGRAEFPCGTTGNLDASGIAALNAATQRKNGFENIGQLIDFTYNEDFFVHIPEVHNPRELGDYYLNKSGMVQMPAEWKNSIDLSPLDETPPRRKKAALRNTATLWKAATNGRNTLRDGTCRRNTAL